MIDTHAHLDGEEYNDDLAEVIARAKEAGVEKIFVPGINLGNSQAVLDLTKQYPGYLYPMLGLHPEDVKEDYKEQLGQIKAIIEQQLAQGKTEGEGSHGSSLLAIGEVGLDYYWSREFEKEQIDAFDAQTQWAVEYQLPLMIHCRKAQNELLAVLRNYKNDVQGGVFHCFTGNEKEAEQYLRYENFVLGIGGVLTFKKSNLPEVLANAVPLSRIVLETDAPYMAPVPNRGKRNESAFMRDVLLKLADIYGTTPEEVERITNENVARVFHV